MSCHCLIRCADTPELRKQVSKMLDYSREIGDRYGTMIALAQLTGPCSHKSVPPPSEEENVDSLVQTH